MIADAADMAERADRLGRIIKQGAFELRIGPGLGDDARAIVRADPGLIGLHDGVERGRIDIALLGQHGLQRADAELDLGQLRVVVVMIVIAHTRRIPEKIRLCRGVVLRYRAAK